MLPVFVLLTRATVECWCLLNYIGHTLDGVAGRCLADKGDRRVRRFVKGPRILFFTIKKHRHDMLVWFSSFPGTFVTTTRLMTSSPTISMWLRLSSFGFIFLAYCVTAFTQGLIEVLSPWAKFQHTGLPFLVGVDPETLVDDGFEKYGKNIRGRIFAISTSSLFILFGFSWFLLSNTIPCSPLGWIWLTLVLELG